MTGKKTNSFRVFPGKGGAKSRPDGYDNRVRQANERNEAWRQLTSKQKLDILKTRPGKSEKQVKRILAGK